MSTLSGPSKLGRMGNGGRFTSNNAIDVRNPSFGHESSSLQNSITHYGSFDASETSRHGKLEALPGEGAEHSASKVCVFCGIGSRLCVPVVSQSQKQKLDHIKVEPLNGQTSDLDRILVKISPKTIPIPRSETDRSSGSSQIAPATTVSTSTLTKTTNPYPQEDRTVELLRLKQELLAANSKIALQEQELAQTRVIKHTLDQALGPSSEADFSSREITEQTISHLQSAFNASSSAFAQFQDAWGAQDDSQSDISDPLSTGAYNRSRALWAHNEPNADREYGESLSGTSSSTSQDPSRFWGVSNAYPPFAGPPSLQSQRPHLGSSASSCGFYSRPIGEQMLYPQAPITGARRSITQSSRGGSLFPIQSTPWGEFVSGSSGEQPTKSSASPKRPPSAFQQVGLYSVPSYPPRPIGSPLSPTATEFTGTNANETIWNNSMSGNSIQTYVSPLEPLNYRRLLDKNVSCDWKYIVDKIICNNDQQASIFLQQKLKVGTTEQKFDIIESIAHQAYPLMVNRFGNFLIQRCFEHGTPEQVVAIANAIRGNTLNLSMDAFGCHVVQKAFDCVSEEHKAIMVHELLRRIPETVVHRYACHVWQKLFELRWSGEPPQVMAKVNEALRGMWHDVALGETGSLVVQNIFENCVEEEKRPAIEEVLAKIDVLARGQFGNWCIQHICEHGAPHDKSRAVEHVLRWAVDYSMDQFASKIVEKCLKIGGTEFMDHYLSRVCTGRSDRPRMPLIDIAGDQYGNYLIQWILMNAAPHQRELVASHIRKHMVSLRGSKFGSRVAMLCCNPSHATRPGPGAGMQVGRFNNFNEDKFATTSQSGGG
ncbi:Armadillo-like helical [Penicillium digitatum]|uniref:PUM-HD domain-containing protein n=3 Tax=Penicillium digitatum TaxID=36651 RepID=K9GIK8_PEND2|nr:hypothetical protein PDIP_26200 [Penicillium digitatum Pd1]EKV13041.1 hypothetical protein PDIG_40650 [Penicillium digitatum PHI26]EKV18734.1 hypothetical protein PDIP_26200 [Penicillium digitatum Pd1]QQK42765.1 Armadillo-like helical [Penicillium digitatum]